MSPSDKLIEEALEAGATVLRNIPGYKPQRRVFKIDVGNIDPQDIEKYLAGVKELTQADKSLNEIRLTFPELKVSEEVIKIPQLGEYDLKFKLTNMMEDRDFWDANGKQISEERFLSKVADRDSVEGLFNNPESKRTWEDMECIRRVLDWIKEDGFGLEVEVIYWALKFMKEDSTISIGEAIMMGFAEWDK